MKYSKKQIQTLIKTQILDMDDEQIAIANHVKECKSCMNTMYFASELCNQHFKISEAPNR